MFGPLTSQLQNVTANFNQALAPLTQITQTAQRVGSALDTINQFASNPQSIRQVFDNVLENSPFSSAINSIRDLSALPTNLVDQFSSLNPIQVVERELAYVLSPIGRQFERLSDAFNIDELSGSIDFQNIFPRSSLLTADFNADGTIAGSGQAARPGSFRPTPTASGSSNKIPNPLRDYNHYNYIITLGVLTAEELNNPEIYRNSGEFRNGQIILRSGGGAYDRRYQTADELAASPPGHAEYFIEDLEIDSVIAPSPNTGVAMGTSVNFTVIEPYSMGLFLEALKGATANAGFINFNHAPWCLKIEFVGWDEYGQNELSIQPPRFIPILFVNTDFNVDVNGSTYRVEAVPYNEVAYSDVSNTTRIDLSAVGSTVGEVLQRNPESIANSINEEIQAAEESNSIPGYDRIAIVFPKNRRSFYEFLTGLTSNTSPATPVDRPVQEAMDRGIPQGEDPRGRDQLPPLQVSPSGPSGPRIFSSILAWASDVNNMNAIGQSRLIDSTNNGANTSMENADNARSGPDDGFRDLPPSEAGRQFEFNQGETITNIIEEVILASLYASEQNIDENSFLRHFRIDTFTLIEPNDPVECQLGRSRRVLVYAIYPYFIDSQLTAHPSSKPSNTDTLKSLASKEYNYIYTGKNEDIIKFDINFNNAFLVNVLGGGINRNPAGGPDDTADTDVNPSTQLNPVDCDRGLNEEGIGTTELLHEIRQIRGGMRESLSQGSRIQIARQIHENIINSTQEMVTAEMEIWGDPYFLPTVTGNYVPAASGRNGINSEESMDYLINQVYTVINFKTPLDYPVNGFVMDMPELVRPFSGLFYVWAVTNRFSSGKFTQELKLIRQKNQGLPGPAAATPNARQSSESTNASERQQSPDARDQANEASVQAQAAAALERRRANPDAPIQVSSITAADFRPDGTIAGAGQTARPGPRLAPSVGTDPFDGVRIDPGTTQGRPSLLRQRLDAQRDPNRPGPQ